MSPIRAHFDGHVFVPEEAVDLPIDKPLRLVVQIAGDLSNGQRQFPMRGRPYHYSDPFEPAVSPADWNAQQ